MAENATPKMLTEVKEYLRLRKELIKTEATIKTTQIASQIALLIISTILYTLSLTFIVIAITLYLKIFVGEIYAYILGGLIFIVVWYIIYLIRGKIIKNPIAKFISTIIKL